MLSLLFYDRPRLCLQIQAITWVGGGGSKFKIEKIFEKIYELKNFTCKRYWLIESSWFWNRFRSQNFWHFSAFLSIQLFFNGLILFFPHQIEPSAHRGPVLKNFRSKKFLLKIIVSPLVIPLSKVFWERNVRAISWKAYFKLLRRFGIYTGGISVRSKILRIYCLNK